VAAEHQAGATATVRVVIISADHGASTVSVRVVDDNGAFLTPAVTLPMGNVRVTGLPVAVGDVLEDLTDGRTAVVRWVDAANPLRWSPSVSGVPVLSSLGFKKVGTFTPTP
jgi:hypothetical protein